MKFNWQIGSYCSYISNEGNAEWSETLPDGKTVNGDCLSGYYGSISRTCDQNGRDANWSPISGSCDGS